MSEENVATIQRAFEHFQTHGDFLEELFAPGFVWDMSNFRGWPEEQRYEGLDGARRFLSSWLSSFDDWSLEVEEVHDVDPDKVVVVLRQRGVSKTSGLPVDMLFAQVYTLRDGLQTRMDMYAEPAEALNATGLPG